MYIEKLSKEEQDLVRETDYYMLLQAAENAIEEADRLWARQLVLAKLEFMAMQVSWDELSELAEISGDELCVVEAVASVKMKIEGGNAEAMFPAEAGHSGEPTPDLSFCKEGSCDRTKHEGEVVINDYSEKWSLIERNQIKEIKNHINDHFLSDGHYNDHFGLDVISNESLPAQIKRQPGYAVVATNTAASPDGGVPPNPPGPMDSPVNGLSQREGEERVPANNQHHVVAKKPKAPSLRPTGAGRSASATALPARHVEVHVWDNYGQDNRPRKADGSYDHGSSRTQFKAAVFLNRKSAAPTYLDQCVSMVDFTSLDKWHRVRPNDRDDPMTEAWYQKWWTEIYDYDFSVTKVSRVGHLRPKNLTGRGGTRNKVFQSAILIRDQETGLPTMVVIIDNDHHYDVSLEDTHSSNKKAPRWKGREIIE